MGETEGTGASATVHGFVGEGSLAQDFLQRVVGPPHDEITDHETCRVPAQSGLEGSQKGSVERLAHGRGVGRHVDEPDVGMRLPMEGQEFLADVHGTHVHEADPWGAAAIGFMTAVSSHVRKAVRVVVVVQWLSEWDVVSSDG